jgi:hypothetical protein
MVVSSLNAAWRRTGLRAPVRLPAAGKQIETRSAPDWRDCLSVSKIVFAAEISRWQQRNSALEIRTAIPIVVMHYCDAL